MKNSVLERTPLSSGLRKLSGSLFYRCVVISCIPLLFEDRFSYSPFLASDSFLNRHQYERNPRKYRPWITHPNYSPTCHWSWAYPRSQSNLGFTWKAPPRSGTPSQDYWNRRAFAVPLLELNPLMGQKDDYFLTIPSSCSLHVLFLAGGRFHSSGRNPSPLLWRFPDSPFPYSLQRPETHLLKPVPYWRA